MTDLCSGLEWNFFGAMAPFSMFAAVLQALVLSVLVALLGNRWGGGSRTCALVLFTVAFLTLSLPAVMLGLSVGDNVCMRAFTGGLLLVGPLGLGLVAVFIGIAWLFEIFEGDRELERIARILVIGTAMTSFAITSLITFHFLESLAAIQDWTVLQLSPWTVGAVNLAFAGGMGYAIVTRPSDSYEVERALRGAGYSAVLVSIGNGISWALAAALPVGVWVPHVAEWLIPIILVAAFAAPAVSLIMLVRTLPRRGYVGESARKDVEPLDALV